MIVLVVDLRYMFGGSVFVRLAYTPFDQFASSVGNHCGDLKIFGTQDGDCQSTLIIYGSLNLSDMCSCRACSTDAQYNTISPV